MLPLVTLYEYIRSSANETTFLQQLSLSCLSYFKENIKMDMNSVNICLMFGEM